MKKVKYLLLIICLIITGCSTQNESQRQNITECENSGGSPIVHYCHGNSNTICSVDCYYENGGGDNE